GAAEVERLEQVRLARAVRSMHDREELAEARLGAGIGAKVAQLHLQHAHRMRSHVQPDRHDQVHELAAVRRFNQAGPQRTDELENELLRLNALKAVAQEFGIEADLELLAVEWHWDRLARLADIGRARRHRERSLAECEPQRLVLLCQQAYAPDDLRHLGPGQTQLVIDRLGQQLAIVGALPIDESGSELRMR